MADLKMPEINSVVIAGNLTKDPIFRQTTTGTPVVNFTIACNRRFRDSNNEWQEDVCYVGVVAWNKLAESCRDNLHKSSAVLVDGELQSRTWKLQDGTTRTVVEIKARRIQFLNKRRRNDNNTNADDSDVNVVEEVNDDTNVNSKDLYEYKYLAADGEVSNNGQ